MSKSCSTGVILLAPRVNVSIFSLVIKPPRRAPASQILPEKVLLGQTADMLSYVIEQIMQVKQAWNEFHTK